VYYRREFQEHTIVQQTSNAELLQAMRECLVNLENSDAADDQVTHDLKQALNKKIAQLEEQQPFRLGENYC
jgi:hypothetical protein